MFVFFSSISCINNYYFVVAGVVGVVVAVVSMCLLNGCYSLELCYLDGEFYCTNLLYDSF